MRLLRVATRRDQSEVGNRTHRSFRARSFWAVARSCGDANACRYGHSTMPTLLPHVPRSAHAPQRPAPPSKAGVIVATASCNETASAVTSACRHAPHSPAVRHGQWEQSWQGLRLRFGPQRARRPARGRSSEPLSLPRDRAHPQLRHRAPAEFLRSPASQLAATSAELGTVPRYRDPRSTRGSRASAPRLPVSLS